MEKSGRFCDQVNQILATIDQNSGSLDVFYHDREGDCVEVKTATKSPFLQFEIEVERKKDGLLYGKIVDIWLLQPDADIEQIFCGDLCTWHRGTSVLIDLDPILVNGGTMKRA